jgi:PPK2 family polyphosphate:nucleotide phosphotransferase
MGADIRQLLHPRPAGGEVDLAAIDPGGTPGLPAGAGKSWARREQVGLRAQLERQQEMLYASARAGPVGSPAARRRVLLVLQGMDCAGKGGTVRRVVGAMNPQGVRVATFGAPTAAERRGHFLWRIRRALPPYGQVGVFDRSHYEDVLVPRVRSLVPEEVWRGRYQEINRFEAELAADGMVIVKVLLHLSYHEQTRRLMARLDDPTKHWKFDPSDIDERLHWEEYLQAYADALSACDTPGAPWFVVPADHKWYRNWAVARLLLETFDDLKLVYPPSRFDVALERQRLERTADLARPVG